MKPKTWSVSDISNPIHIGNNTLEILDDNEQWHDFSVIVTATRVVFGSYCNAGFMESGYIVRDDSESMEETITELISELETYYNNGPKYTTRIVVNERM